MPQPLKCPWPYFGGKSRVAKRVWQALGQVDNFVEPFCGSLAVLLNRPPPPRGVETINDAGMLVSNFGRATHAEHGNREAVQDALWETVNDADPFLVNAWRSIQQAPAQAAEWADHPVDESYLHAVHRWLVYGDGAEEFRQRMRRDPDFFDPKRAGRWMFGLCCWIGGGWCAHSDGTGRRPMLSTGDGTGGQGVHKALRQKMPLLTNNGDGQGVHAGGQSQQVPRQLGGRNGSPGILGGPVQRLPDLAGDAGAAGRGVHSAQSATRGGRPQLADAYDVGRGVHSHGDLGTCEARRQWLTSWFQRLADRLRLVRVCCGDWSRICSSESTTTRLGLTGVFLDPPYPVRQKGRKKSRDGGLYATDAAGGTEALRDDVLAWCREYGPHPKMRIVVAGYEGDGYEALVGDHGWREEEWKAQGGYGNRSGVGRENAKRERLWFSPACLWERGLFDQVEAAP